MNTCNPVALQLGLNAFNHMGSFANPYRDMSSLDLTPKPMLMSRRQFTPSRDDDWQSRKGILYDLYMEDNENLGTVRGIMLAEHSFSATERMYKRQFRKWEWFKYKTKNRENALSKEGNRVQVSQGKTKRRPRRLQRASQKDASGKGASGEDALPETSPSRDGSCHDPSLPIILPHANSESRCNHNILLTLRNIVHSYYNCSRTENGSDLALILGQYNIRFGFQAAVELFATGNDLGGGAILRPVFDLLKACIMADDRIHYKHLCLWVPSELHKAGHHQLLKMYLGFLQEMAALKENRAVAQLCGFLQQSASTRPEQFDHIIQTMRLANAQCLRELEGTRDPDAVAVVGESYQQRLEQTTPGWLREKLIETVALELMEQLSDAAAGLGTIRVLERSIGFICSSGVPYAPLPEPEMDFESQGIILSRILEART